MAVVGAALASGDRATAAEELCDANWFTRPLVVEVGERKADGTPPKAYDAANPMVPYELAGARYHFGDKTLIYEVIGQFRDRAEGKAALTEIETKYQQYWKPTKPPVLTTLGAYLPQDERRCTITRKNKLIDPASWIVETDGVLLVGAHGECKGGSVSKTVAIVGCDGMKTIAVDTVTAPCGSGIATCMHPLSPGVVLFHHWFSPPDGGTNLRLRVYDVRKGKRLQSIDGANDGGPDSETMGVVDVDKDGVPEVVFERGEDRAKRRVLSWKKNKFAERKTR